VEARREKARRGELIQAAPVGYIKTEDQRLEKDPDLRVQRAIALVFRKFVELGTVRQTLMWFLEHGLQVPRVTSEERLVGSAQGTPFDTGFQALQNLFTGTVAKVASLIAIVIGGYQFAHGEPGAKRALAGVAAGTGIAVLATNVLTWLWG
jgi:type IV secretory pathway VirB2 component (pilin)